VTTDTAAGYSGTPLPKKLGIKSGHRVLFEDAPEGFDPQPMPGDVAVDHGQQDGPYDVVLAFVPDRAALDRAFETLPAKLDRAGSLWICWPKKSSGIVTDVSETVVRDEALALPIGLVDVKIAAIDATWSGLKLVYRLTRR
jgi:hypothetical protein